MLSFSSVFSGQRGGGMTNPGIEQRRMGGDRTRAASAFNPASAGAQFSVAGGNSPRNRGRRADAVTAAAQARRQAR